MADKGLMEMAYEIGCAIQVPTLTPCPLACPRPHPSLSPAPFGPSRGWPGASTGAAGRVRTDRGPIDAARVSAEARGALRAEAASCELRGPRVA